MTLPHEFRDFRFNELHNGVLAAEASELGFPPGAPMPRAITLTDSSRTYHFARTAREDGEIVGWEYTLRGNPKLVIFND